MKRKLLKVLCGLAFLAGVAFWWVTRPVPLPENALAGLTGDAVKGEALFWQGGCASCHADEKAEGDAKLILGGGRAFPSPFGTFYAPNISSDPVHGVGNWTPEDLANAMLRGVSPQGKHYFPAFPYTSYVRMENHDETLQQIADLHSYLATLPTDPTPNKAHAVGFPFKIRRALGGWKFLFFSRDQIVTGDLTAQQRRGRYLVEGPGHCGECHTPRNALGGIDTSRWLAGAPDPSGKGRVPNITPAALDWSERDIAAYLQNGFTPDYDSAGGHMADVVQNTAKLSAEDRSAIAAYLKIVPPVK